MRRAHRQLQKHGLPLVSNQVEYSLLNRSIESNGILESARDLGVTIIAYTPLASGLLTGKYKNPELLEKKSFFWRSRLKRRLKRAVLVPCSRKLHPLQCHCSPGGLELDHQFTRATLS